VPTLAKGLFLLGEVDILGAPGANSGHLGMAGKRRRGLDDYRLTSIKLILRFCEKLLSLPKSSVMVLSTHAY
jgi:hypothetical protein